MLTSVAAGPTDAVVRTVAVLDAFRGPDQLQLSEIAERAGLPMPTAYRYLQGLVRAGRVERIGKLGSGAYALTASAHQQQARPFEDLPIRIADQSARVVGSELVKLQAETGQVALLYASVGVPPMRMCTSWAMGVHRGTLLTAPTAQLHALWQAPLDADASGAVIRAFRSTLTKVRAPMPEPRPAAARALDLRRIQEQGHATAAAPVEGWQAIAVPLWCASTVAGAVTLLAQEHLARNVARRARYVDRVMDTAGVISRHLTRVDVRCAV
ncbi:DNA-binding transcriptional regulator, IclR family [Actinacidiphila glaucinigra]|uniref:DNA-binding transcriptional regulator, IclR family n=1 Tax=Actinacidiphila glaucinigra TaxID=235986 RepID=A0A239LWF8_9ACTN|nr:DNA-binding transcriptional regulator, IclR family [Actinacidiphila glaucinigra]